MKLNAHDNGAHFKENFPEVEDAVRAKFNANYLRTVGEKKFVKHGFIVDSGFLNMFGFPMRYRNPAKAPDDILILCLRNRKAKK